MYNIGAVARMTNIQEATLRVWERRYHFPQATRTSGGHRLYTQQDVWRLQWVKARMEAGMQVGHAIRAMQQAEADGTLVPMPNAPNDLFSSTLARKQGDNLLAATSLVNSKGTDATSLVHLQSRLLDALKGHDLDEATALLTAAQALYPLEELLLEVIGPTLQEIGAAWERGELDVATEHLATNHLRTFLVMWMRVGPPTFAVNPVLLACAPGELHEGSLLMLGVMLRRLRWPVLYLGQTMPLAELAIFAEELSPSVLVFVAMTQEAAIALLGMARWLPQAAAGNEADQPPSDPKGAPKKAPLICYGGRAFVEHPELRTEMDATVAAIYLGDTVAQGVDLLDRRLHKLNQRLG